MLSLARRSIVEMIGTFTLVAIGTGSVMVSARTHAFGSVGISMAFGLAVAVIVIALAPLSGAHINPAVTLGFWSIGRFHARDVLPYVIAQCLGAILASFACGWMLGPVGRFGATIPSISLARAFAVEFGFTALLGFVIMRVPSRDKPALAAAIIGLTVFVGAWMTGPLTGGSFNPARSLGPAMASGLWRAHWLYWMAPTAGMVLAMQAHKCLQRASGDVPAASITFHTTPE